MRESNFYSLLINRYNFKFHSIFYIKFWRQINENFPQKYLFLTLISKFLINLKDIYLLTEIWQNLYLISINFSSKHRDVQWRGYTIIWKTATKGEVTILFHSNILVIKSRLLKLCQILSVWATYFRWSSMFTK